ncbi:MAG: rhomboid family intramembrane serine protease [Candidatus Bathyarchaeota archaeon]|nr:rhomboid family intramembrane serine protease [Candidatus Bathyarchaeota archaeon]
MDIQKHASFSLTYALLTVNLAVYAYTSLVGGNFVVTEDRVLAFYGQFNLLVLEGWYWQLFTAMFVHASIVHLLGNMLFLLIFGLRAEELFTELEYLAIYISSGLAGNLLTLLLGPYTVSAGASGAIFGLLGACTMYLRRSIGQSVISALLYSFFLLMMFSASPNVNFLAHFGGLVVGLLAGYVVVAKQTFKIKYEHTASYE